MSQHITLRSAHTPRGVTLSPCGLQGVTADNWRECGELLHRVDGCLNWARGDWAASAELGYGDLKAECKRLGLDYGTMRNLAWVARRFELSLRSDNVPFHVFKTLAEIESTCLRLEGLRLAAENGWTVAQTREWVQAQKALPLNQAAEPATAAELEAEEVDEQQPAPPSSVAPDSGCAPVTLEACPNCDSTIQQRDGDEVWCATCRHPLSEPDEEEEPEEPAKPAPTTDKPFDRVSAKERLMDLTRRELAKWPEELLPYAYGLLKQLIPRKYL